MFKLIRDMRGGKDYDAKWGERMTGSGPIAWMIGRRFEAACERLGLNRRKLKLSTAAVRTDTKAPATAFVTLRAKMKTPRLNAVTLGVSDFARSRSLLFRSRIRAALQGNGR